MKTNKFYTYQVKENKIFICNTLIDNENSFNNLIELLKQLKGEYPNSKIIYKTI